MNIILSLYSKPTLTNSALTDGTHTKWRKDAIPSAHPNFVKN